MNKSKCYSIQSKKNFNSYNKNFVNHHVLKFTTNHFVKSKKASIFLSSKSAKIDKSKFDRLERGRRKKRRIAVRNMRSAKAHNERTILQNDSNRTSQKSVKFLPYQLINSFPKQITRPSREDGYDRRARGNHERKKEESNRAGASIKLIASTHSRVIEFRRGSVKYLRAGALTILGRPISSSSCSKVSRG